MVRLLVGLLAMVGVAMAGAPDLRVLGAIGGIDGKTVANTTLFTTENGTERCYPVLAIVEATAGSVITVGPTVSIGTNSATFNNILAATSMTLVLLTNTMQVSLATGVLPSSVAANTAVTVRVSVGAVGTSQTLRVTLLGYYQ